VENDMMDFSNLENCRYIIEYDHPSILKIYHGSGNIPEAAGRDKFYIRDQTLDLMLRKQGTAGYG
jgi:hypothetical protein